VHRFVKRSKPPLSLPVPRRRSWICGAALRRNRENCVAGEFAASDCDGGDERGAEVSGLLERVAERKWGLRFMVECDFGLA